jgi:type I restriction enzyme S subunit
MIYKLKDLCDINTTTLKNNHNLPYIDYLDTANLNQGSIDSLQRLQIGVDSIPSRAKRVVRDNDILFSTVRPNQLHYGFISKSKKNLICSTGFAVLTPKDNIIPYYLYKYLTQKHIIEYLQGIAETSTSTYPSIKPSDIGELDIDTPSLAKQQAIANILSSLDDKIELNNKINKNLEKLAQTLYKRWFVDFEFPNEDGEPYKSSGGEMVESELGLIPKGWRILTLDDLVVKSRTKTNPDSNQKLIDMANMPSYSIALNSFGYGDKLSTNTYRMNKFSLLYGSIRPYLGKFGIAPFEGITTGTIHNFNVKDNSDYSLVATTVFSTKFNEFCIRLSHGTKMPTIKWDDFVSYKVIYSGEVSYKFNKIVRVMFDRIVNNVLENLKLSKTRDELLPKLMNGEIEVPIEE